MRIPTPTSDSIVARATEARPVIVVGGGIAGLTTAWELQQLGVPVTVIEATPHRGGRICSIAKGGDTVETGMQFYYSSYKQTHRLLKEFGLRKELVKIPVRGVMVHNGEIGHFDKDKPWLKLLSFGDNLRLQFAVAKQIFRIIGMKTFDFRRDEKLDQVDVAEYFRRNGGEDVLELAARPMVNSYAFCEPENHSMAMLCRILKLGGTAGTYGLRTGNDSLPRAMAERLNVVEGRVQDVVVEGGAVRGVVVERGGRRETMGASAVVSAIHGERAASIFQDALPDLAAQYRELSYSTIILANLHLDRPIEGDDWCYTMSRTMGHRGAFAIDLRRRMPQMFPANKSVIQMNFAMPFSETLLGSTDDEITQIAIEDMKTFLPDIGDWVTGISVTRRVRALPNFTVGMFEKVRAIQDRAAQVEGLFLAGDYLRAPLCEGAVRSGMDAVASMAVAPLPSAERLASPHLGWGESGVRGGV